MNGSRRRRGSGLSRRGGSGLNGSRRRRRSGLNRRGGSGLNGGRRRRGGGLCGSRRGGLNRRDRIGRDDARDEFGDRIGRDGLCRGDHDFELERTDRKTIAVFEFLLDANSFAVDVNAVFTAKIASRTATYDVSVSNAQ